MYAAQHAYGMHAGQYPAYGNPYGNYYSNYQYNPYGQAFPQVGAT
jgi:hypothetical protein